MTSPRSPETGVELEIDGLPRGEVEGVRQAGPLPAVEGRDRRDAVAAGIGANRRALQPGCGPELALRSEEDAPVRGARHGQEVRVPDDVGLEGLVPEV